MAVWQRCHLPAYKNTRCLATGAQIHGQAMVGGRGHGQAAFCSKLTP